MKRALLNERWDFWVPDNVANWDAITSWERERLASMEEHLSPGMVLYDIGAEHGWLSAIYGTFVGHENMVLVEPSPFFWPNIRMIWEMNEFKLPLATFCAYASASVRGNPNGEVWPTQSDGPECDAAAYLSLAHENRHDIPWMPIDSAFLRKDALTIDVEGAELWTLRGAAVTLGSWRPLVWVSVHPDLMERDYQQDAAELHAMMERFDYVGELLAVDHEEHWFYRPKERV